MSTGGLQNAGTTFYIRKGISGMYLIMYNEIQCQNTSNKYGRMDVCMYEKTLNASLTAEKVFPRDHTTIMFSSLILAWKDCLNILKT